MPKKNFKYVVIGHAAAIIVMLVILLFLLRPKDDKVVLESMIGALSISLIVQLLLYKAKPSVFGDKVTVHPDQPEQL